MGDQEFKELLREAALLLGLDCVSRYRKAGCPFERSVEAMLVWLRYGGRARGN